MNQKPENETLRHGEWRMIAGICLVLAGLVWITFGQAIHFGFVNFDDDVYVYKNANVTGGLTQSGVRWAFTHVHSSNWHPLTWMSHMADSQFYGLNAGGHHLTSILIHISTVLLLFLVLRQMTGFLWRSAFVAAVFAIHPLRVESVVWVAERKDVLSGFFFVLTIAVYAWYARSTWSLGRYLLVALVYSFALMSKPMVVTVPFVLLLLDYWPLKRLERPEGGPIPWRPIMDKIPLVALSGIVCVITLFAQKEAVAALPLSTRIANALVSCVIYLRQMIYPSGLVVLYPFPEGGVALLEVIGACCLLLAISVGVIAVRRKYPWLLVGWLWYLGMLIPVVGVLQVGAQAHADRYTYLPQIGLYLAITWTVVEFGVGWIKYRWLLSGSTAIVLTLLIVCARHQTSYWKDSNVLWSRALEFTSGNVVAHNNLGNALLDAGNLNAAIGHFQIARQIKPGDAKAAFNLGNALIQKGRLNDGIMNLEQALLLKPDYADAHINLGSALLKVENVGEAIGHFQKALQIEPSQTAAWNDLGYAHLQQGAVEEAIVCFQKAMQLNPKEAVTRNNLGNALVQQGKMDEAIVQYRSSLQLKPEYPEAQYNLGTALVQKGNVDEAIAHFREALRLKPDYSSAAYNIGIALFHEDKVNEAASFFQRAIQINPDYAEAHYNLGNALVREGKIEEGITHLQKALQIEPGQFVTGNNLGYILLQNGKTDEAINELQKVLQARPDYPAAHFNLGNALFQKGNIDEAIGHFREALQHEPGFAEAHYRLGTALLQKGQETGALEHFQQAVRMKPDFAEALNDLAWELATAPQPAARDGKQAVELAKRADQLTGGKDLDILDTIAAAYAEANRFDEAIRAARQAIEFARSSGQQDRVAQLSQELALYENGHPFHRDGSGIAEAKAIVVTSP